MVATGVWQLELLYPVWLTELTILFVVCVILLFWDLLFKETVIKNCLNATITFISGQPQLFQTRKPYLDPDAF